MTRLVFLDTETTGLTLDDDIWEIAAIVRDPGRPDHEHRVFVEHDLVKAATLPESFRADHDARYDAAQALSRPDAAEFVEDLTADGAHIVGAVPNFDTERLALLMRGHGLTPGWHYHLIDVEALAVGYLWGRHAADDDITGAVGLPWDSEWLSKQLGVAVPSDGVRHTALGDAMWARDIYDRITGGNR